LEKRPLKLEEFNEKWNEVLPLILDFKDHPDREAISQKIREYYWQKRSIGHETFRETAQFYSDSIMYQSIDKAIVLHTQKTKSPIYAYYFTYQAESGLTSILTRMLGGLPRLVDFLIGTSRRWFASKVEPESIKRHGEELWLLN
jgi:hypothetical protein